jgi:hypothetical protein
MNKAREWNLPVTAMGVMGLAMLAAMAAPASAQNLILNPGFETNTGFGSGQTATSWSSDDATQLFTDNDNVHGGLANLHVNDTTPFSGLREFQMTPNGSITGGLQYTFSFYENPISIVNSNPQWDIQWFDAGGAFVSEVGFTAIPQSPTGAYQLDSNTVTAPATADHGQVIFLAAIGPGSVNMDIDDVSLSPVPEPASLSLLALGGLGLIARRRRA